MVKIVIEVSEGFIEEIGNVANMDVLIKEKGLNPLEAMVNIMPFSFVESLVKQGRKEFIITPDIAKDEGEVSIFNAMMRNAGAMILCKERQAKKETLEKENKNGTDGQSN